MWFFSRESIILNYFVTSLLKSDIIINGAETGIFTTRKKLVTDDAMRPFVAKPLAIILLIIDPCLSCETIITICSILTLRNDSKCDYMCVFRQNSSSRKVYLVAAKPNAIDSRYIAVQYSTILHTAQHLRMRNFGQTLNSRKTPISRPNGRTIGPCLSWVIWRKVTARYRGSAAPSNGWLHHHWQRWRLSFGLPLKRCVKLSQAVVYDTFYATLFGPFKYIWTWRR